MVPLKISIHNSFYQQEEREGFIVSPEMKKIWAVELDLLNEFARVCAEHDLKWFVHAGTMLGTVRHHGYIPWDDDVDVVMPRKDYEVLCAIASSVFSSPYFLQNGDSDRCFAKNFSRLRNSLTTAIPKDYVPVKYPYNQGIYIDIFPYDNIPDNVEQRNEYYEELTWLNNRAWVWMDMVHRYRSPKGLPLKKRAKSFIKHLYFKYVLRKQDEYKRLLKRHHELVTKFNGTETDFVGESIVPPLGRWEWKRDWIDSVVYMPFEMLSVPVPVGFSECLEAGFGKDWRVPKRMGAFHGRILFDVDKPYTEYLGKRRCR